MLKAFLFKYGFDGVRKKDSKDFLTTVDGCHDGCEFSRRCTDKTLTVNILDENDNAPVFEDLSVLNYIVREDTAIGTTIAKVHAVDADSRYPEALIYVSESQFLKS